MKFLKAFAKFLTRFFSKKAVAPAPVVAPVVAPAPITVPAPKV